MGLREEYQGKKVKLLEDMQGTNFIQYFAGSIWEVTCVWKGLSLTGERCEHCGYTPYIRHVPVDKVEFV